MIRKNRLLSVLLILAMLATVFSCWLPVTEVSAASPFYGKVPGINEYSRICFWYGTCNETHINTLKTYDIVVLEPTLRVLNVKKNQFYMESLSNNQVEEIKKGIDGILGNADDVIVLGYISVGEMLANIIPGSSGHMTIQKGIELGLLPEGYSGPSGPVHGPNPWNYNSSGQYIHVEGGTLPDGTYNDGYAGYSNLDIADDYSSWGSRLTFRNNGYMPWYLDQQGTWINDSRYLYGGYWKDGDGVIDTNKYYGGGYINAGDPAWQKFVTFQVEKLVHDCGFDGVFLDTVDTPDPVGGAGPSISWGPRGNFGWTAEGMVELVEKIKAVDPTKIVASNRGYWYFNPDEGTSQFAARYRHAINMFITESWYYNCYIPGFYDTSPGFEGNWNTDPSSPDYRIRDNFGGFWKEYMNGQANQSDGFNIAIIDFMVPSSGTNKWMNEVVLNSGYLGYAVSGAQHFNSAIYNDAKNWLDAGGYPGANLSGFHDKSGYGGFYADGDFSEWNGETPIYSDPAGNNAKGITKVYTKFINDKFFMMVESKTTLNMAQEYIYFDFDQDGPVGWQPWWPLSPETKLYFETANKVYLFPWKGPGDVFVFDSPSSPSNRGWPVKSVQSGNKCELEFDKSFIFGPGTSGKEVWTWFRVANFGGSSIKFNVPADGPSITNVHAESISDTSQAITWTTDVPSSTVVEYGLTTAYGSTKTGTGNVTNHSVTLTGLTKGTTYNFRVKSTDSNNRTTVSPNYTFTTSDSTTPPTLSNIQVTNKTASGATITWTTDQTSNSVVEYGPTTSYGTTRSDSAMVTNHSITLNGLNPGSTYHFRVKSTNAFDITATSADHTFTTASNPVYPAITIDGNSSDWNGIAPVVTGSTSVQNLSAANNDTHLYLLVKGTGLNVKGQFYIDTDNNKSTGFNPTGWGQSGADYMLENNYLWKYNGSNNSWSWTNNKIMASFSRNDTTVEVAVPFNDLGISAGSTIGIGYLKNDSPTERLPANGANLPVTTLLDGSGGGTPAVPVISGVSSSNITQTGATINWTTDVPSSTVVEYGLSTSYGSAATGPSDVTSHSVPLSGLTAGTTYHYRVKSTNSAGTATSSDYTFTTSQGGGGIITIDGNFGDWSGISPYATDPQDAGGGNGDAKALSIESGSGSLYAKLDVYGTFAMSTVNILYIDSDNNAGTGYFGGGWPAFGGDYRIVYSNGFNPPKLQRFSGGSQGSDSWVDVTVLNGAFSGGSAEVGIPYNQLGGVSTGTTVKLLFRPAQDAAPDFWAGTKPTYTLK